MQIALSGAHGVGKTTLIEEITLSGLFPEYNISTNLTRKLKEQGYNISEHGNDDTQLEIMRIHKNNMKYPNIIMDRCALDCYAYTEYLYQHFKICGHTHNTVFLDAMDCIQKYTKIFYIKPEFELEDDGLRPIDKEFQTEIADIFDHAISYYKINVIPLSGTIDQRITTFKQVLGI